MLGFDLAAQDGDRVRYRVPGAAGVVDLLDTESAYGKEGVGTIHHVAVGAGDRSLAAWRDHLSAAGLEPTRIKDRRYFESVYAREPGGLLFEVATAGPGFAVDEAPDALGESLQLPSQFEPDREMIEAHLPDVDAPDYA